jgi:hypothetical protein
MNVNGCRLSAVALMHQQLAEGGIGVGISDRADGVGQEQGVSLFVVMVKMNLVVLGGINAVEQVPLRRIDIIGQVGLIGAAAHNASRSIRWNEILV